MGCDQQEGAQGNPDRQLDRNAAVDRYSAHAVHRCDCEEGSGEEEDVGQCPVCQPTESNRLRLRGIRPPDECAVESDKSRCRERRKQDPEHRVATRLVWPLVPEMSERSAAPSPAAKIIQGDIGAGSATTQRPAAP
jgi:hypothetical protein